MLKRLRQGLASLCLVVLTLSSGGCGGDDLPDMQGLWGLVTNSVTFDTCGRDFFVFQLGPTDVRMTQSGTNITITVYDGVGSGAVDFQFPAKLRGNRLEGSGTYTESLNQCDLAISVAIDARASESSVTGLMDFQFHGSGNLCPGIFCSVTNNVAITRK